MKDIKITFTKYDHLPTEVYAEETLAVRFSVVSSWSLVGTIDDQGFFSPNQAYDF